jgi:hypothetical protein
MKPKHEIFTDCATDAIHACIALDVFADMALRNWRTGQGNEEELYPFFNELLRRTIPWMPEGIGSGSLRNSRQKIDSLLHLDQGVFAVEFKGPSKDHGFLDRETAADYEKLKTLTNGGIIQAGIACGFYLEPPCATSHYCRTISDASEQIGVRVRIMRTDNVLKQQQDQQELTCTQES